MYENPSDPDDEEAGYGYSNGMSQQERDVYYYHSDHLGSTSYITDKDGKATQFVCYKPYGETLVDEHATSYEMPWKFNGKELDAETGLYYYGARYYEPVIALWYGVDALTEKYPSIGSYVYCVVNPVRIIDPNGNEGEDSNATVASTIVNTILSTFPAETRKAVQAKISEISKQKGFDWSKVAIGVETIVGQSTTSVVKGEMTGILGNVIFLGGEDAGYVYSYYGGEIGAGIETSVGTSISLGRSVFVAYNHSNNKEHTLFDGDYKYINSSLGMSTGSLTFGIDLGLVGTLSIAKGEDWSVFSTSIEATAGVGVSTIPTIGATTGKGHVSFLDKSNVGKPKSAIQKIISYGKLL